MLGCILMRRIEVQRSSADDTAAATMVECILMIIYRVLCARLEADVTSLTLMLLYRAEQPEGSSEPAEESAWAVD
jgi:hypothetical protein